MGGEEKEKKYFCSPLMNDENEVQKEVSTSSIFSYFSS